jgi:hypothetical protein
MMTRKDYIKLAQAFRDELEHVDFTGDEDNDAEAVITRRATVARLVQRISAVLQADNPRFDPERFERAAYADHFDQEATR